MVFADWLDRSPLQIIAYRVLPGKSLRVEQSHSGRRSRQPLQGARGFRAVPSRNASALHSAWANRVLPKKGGASLLTDENLASGMESRRVLSWRVSISLEAAF